MTAPRLYRAPAGPPRAAPFSLAVAALVLAGALVAPAPAAAQTLPPALLRRVESWYNQTRRAAHGRWGVAIADERGTLLWGRDADRPLIPASTVKIFTTGFARTRVGPQARKVTRVHGVGMLDSASGRWIGTWSLELNGDPSLEDPHHVGPRLYDLAAQLAAAGIRRLDGPLLVTSANGPATAVFPVNWPARDRGSIFAPLVGPLTVHENTVSAWVAPAWRHGRRPRIANEAPTGIGALIQNEATTRTGRGSRLKLVPHRSGWILKGWIGTRSGAREVRAIAQDPQAVLEVVWGQALRQAGITWAADEPDVLPPTDGRDHVLAEVYSPVFDSLAADIDRRSLNLGAELLLHWAAGTDGAADSLAAHVAAVTGTSDGLRLVDGSGLSDLDRVTPRLQVTYLAKFPALSSGRNFPQLLPANGTGTLRRMGNGLPATGVVRAKTGTLNNVAALAGYLGRSDGVLTVSVIYNGGRTKTARRAQWRLFRLLGARGVVVPPDFDSPADSAAADSVAAEGEIPAETPADTAAAWVH